MTRRDLFHLAVPATVASLGLAGSGRVCAQEPPAEAPKGKRDVIYLPTPQVVVDAMLELAEVKEGDVLYDLGCGDGRIVVTAAKKYGIKAVGVDIDPVRVRESRENVARNDVGKLVTIREENLFDTDMSPASVVTLYLLPSINLRLRPRLAHLKAGTRIVSHSFPIRGARPAKTQKVATSSATSR